MTPERRGALAVAGAALLWSSGGLGIKAVAAPALTIACWRSAVAALALGLLWRARPRVSRVFLLAVACYAGCVTTFVVATKWTTAANAILLQYSGVVWVLLLAPVVLGERFQGRDAIAIAVALGGLALVLLGGLGAAGGAGDLVALVSSVLFAGVILSLRAARPGDQEAAVTWGNVLAAGALLPVVGVPTLDPRSALVLAFLGVVQIAAAYVLFVRGIRHVPATQAALIGMIEPVANPLWVLLGLGERPGASALLGGAIVLGAIAWRTLGAGVVVPPVPPPRG